MTLGLADRYHLCFALGKALEDSRDYAGSFGHYDEGNACAESRYDAEELSEYVRRSSHADEEFFAARRGLGSTARLRYSSSACRDPARPCSSRSSRATRRSKARRNLLTSGAIARQLAGRGAQRTSLYPEALAGLGADELRALGERYLGQTRIQRKTGKPFFIDKMPNNFEHVALIHLILPNAKIIDARRHPMGCCFSIFKQQFARGQHFTYDLGELGRYYRTTSNSCTISTRSCRACVHRVFYENMVEDTEAEVRRLLEYCGLPFEDAVLRFHENQRAVRTASSEQVRRPHQHDGRRSNSCRA